ncbi:MAG: hypothetical protein R2862_08945 [Thermoanaerobaculia bacterium]
MSRILTAVAFGRSGRNRRRPETRLRIRYLLPVGASLVFLLGAVAPLRATDDVGAAEAIESEREIARVELDGALIVRVRGTSAFPATQRAAEITERICRLAADPISILGTTPSGMRPSGDLIAGGTRLFVAFQRRRGSSSTPSPRRSRRSPGPTSSARSAATGRAAAGPSSSPGSSARPWARSPSPPRFSSSAGSAAGSTSHALAPPVLAVA